MMGFDPNGANSAVPDETNDQARRRAFEQVYSGLGGQTASRLADQLFTPSPLGAMELGNNNNPAFQYGGKVGGAQDQITRLQGLGAAATNPRIDYSNYDAGRNALSGYMPQENANLSQLASMAAGNGPSAARQQLGIGLDQGLKQQLSLAASARGGGANIAAAGQNAQTGMSNLASQTNQAMGLARVNEQLGATQQYTQALTNRRSQQLQLMGMDADNAYKQAAMETQGRQLQQQYEAMGMSVQEAQMRAQQALLSAREGHWATQMGADEAAARAQEANAYRVAGLGLGAVSAAGTLGSLGAAGAGKAAAGAAPSLGGAAMAEYASPSGVVSHY